MNVSGNWVQSGGSFVNNNGIVNFDGTGTQSFDSDNSSFYSIVNSGSGVVQLTGHNLTVSSTFTNSSGTFDANGRPTR